MQELNWSQTNNLNNALSSTEVIEINGQQVQKSVLKSGKHLSGDVYLRLMSLKKKLRNTIEDIAEKEKILFEDNDYVLQGAQWVPPQNEDAKAVRNIAKEISKKLDAIHKDVKLEIEDAFIPKGQFLEWTKECNNDVASILAEFLLEGF